MQTRPEPWKPPSPLPAPLKTKRTLVRQYQRDDAQLLFEAVNASRNALIDWLPWAEDEHAHVNDSIYWVENTIRKRSQPDCDNFPFGVFTPDGGTLLGGVGFHRIAPKRQTGEIGYWIRGDRHNQGLCTEMVSAVLSSAFRSQADGGWGFRRIILLCASENIGSKRIPEKLGMRLERQEFEERFQPRPEPRHYHTFGYAVLASEWDSDAGRAKPGISWHDLRS